MNQGDQTNKAGNSEEITVMDLIAKIKSGTRYIKTKWVTILIASIFGALVGLGYSIFKRLTYTAVCTFVLEDGNKSGGMLSQYAGLASLAGVDLNSSSGLFQGDNIIELYKSRLMIEKTLLSEVIFDKKRELLIDRYIDFKGLRRKWKNHDNIDTISFKGNPDNFNRHQDSIITDIVEIFNKRYLTVVKPDKKLNIINVGFSSKDELFAKEFTDKLVENVNDFYVLTKTQKSYQNVQVLQHQADSVKQALNSSITGVASAIDAAPNANPQLLSLRVSSQKKQIDVQASTAVYGEIVKNLEISKISLRQEKPLIQIIDKPVLPLGNDRLEKWAGIVIGFIMGGIIAIIFALLKKTTVKNNTK
jgi:LPS O-antigen subunit length determinant protein (WzzB/FepE family)